MRLFDMAVLLIRRWECGSTVSALAPFGSCWRRFRGCKNVFADFIRKKYAKNSYHISYEMVYKRYEIIHPCARADSRANSHDGSELFIVDVWSLNKSRPVNPGDHEPAPGVLVTCEPKPCQLRLLFNQSSSCAATLLMTVCV
jgi:hypothetical protein